MSFKSSDSLPNNKENLDNVIKEQESKSFTSQNNKIHHINNKNFTEVKLSKSKSLVSNSSEFTSNINPDSVVINVNVLSSLKPFLYECQTQLYRRQYRKVYEDIDTKETVISKTVYYVQFLVIKINALLKILASRLKHYNPSKFLSTSQWFKRLEVDCNNFHVAITGTAINEVAEEIIETELSEKKVSV